MKIGILSDSHGKSHRLLEALDALTARGADVIVHCGDLGNTEAIELLGEARPEAYVVAGNVDHKVGRLDQAAQKYHVHFSWEVIEVPLDNGRHLAATHGSDEQILGELIADEQFPYVCHGHTHRARDERRGKVRIINPGSLYHPRNPHHPTAVILDTDTDVLEWIEL